MAMPGIRWWAVLLGTTVLAACVSAVCRVANCDECMDDDDTICAVCSNNMALQPELHPHFDGHPVTAHFAMDQMQARVGKCLESCPSALKPDCEHPRQLRKGINASSPVPRLDNDFLFRMFPVGRNPKANDAKGVTCMYSKVL